MNGLPLTAFEARGWELTFRGDPPSSSAGSRLVRASLALISLTPGSFSCCGVVPFRVLDRSWRDGGAGEALSSRITRGGCVRPRLLPLRKGRLGPLHNLCQYTNALTCYAERDWL